MNGLTPNCIDDFIFSNQSGRSLLEMILSRQLPFPLGGKSGILLHGIWGTGKTTLAQLLPELIEVAYEGAWNMAPRVRQFIVNFPHLARTGSI
jgi:Holliday junction resolvasome RuvABC ATP-dependent DNA helicase subunit